MKKILGFLATGCLALAANTASAIPLQIEVGGVGVVAGGDWELSGTGYYATDSWNVTLLSYESWVLDISPGAYLWEISGWGVLSDVGWRLSLAGQQVYNGSQAGLFFEISDDYRFVAVPEPGTLGLLGLGLWAVGFAARRRSGRSSARQV